MRFSRRRTLQLALAGSLSSPAIVHAQAWPAKPIRLVVPFAAGAGILDIMGRLMAQHLGPALGQQIVVDNKPGAGGNLGADIVAKAPADGYTLMVGNQAIYVSPFLYAKLGFDPLSDFVPITQVNSAPLMMVVHPAVPVERVAQLILHSHANPGKVTYGSGGVGSTPFLATELLKSMGRFEATHVPYRGGAPALADLVGGQLTFMIENVPATLPLVKDGKLRALAITSKKRSPLAPNVPTFDEGAVPGYEVIGWNGIFAPKGTPPEIVARLNIELVKILRMPEVIERMTTLGAEAIGSTQAAFTAFTRAEHARWGKIIQDKGIKPE